MGNVCSVCSSYNSISTQTGTAGKNKVGPDVGDEEPAKRKTWNDVFDHVVRVDLWEGTARASRPEWRPYLSKIAEMSRLPRREMDEDKIKDIFSGRTRTEDMPDPDNKITLYVCTTGTDTEVERTVLMKDVYPFIRDTCRQLRLEFEVIDLRWGITTQDNQEFSELVLHELQRFKEARKGSVFLCFLSDEYGPRLLPSELEEETLETIMAYLINNEMDTSLIKQFYILDKNSIRRKYILKTEKDDKGAQNISSASKENLLKLLKEAVPECFPCGPEMIAKYFASLYEYEVLAGLQCSGQTIFVKKVVEKANSSDVDSAKVNPNASKAINTDEYQHLKEINQDIDNKLKENNDEIVQVTYDDINEMASGENTIQLSDIVCKKLLKLVMQFHKTSEPAVNDQIMQEILVQNKFSLQMTQEFYGREREIETVRKYIEDDNIKVPLVIHGVQGVGKSAFMATVARLVKLPHYVLIPRHVGITTESSHVKELLASICSQLILLYDKPVLNTSASYKDMIVCFRQCLGYATKKEPIVIFLDSLNNLSDENFAYNLRWLQLEKELPANVKIVLSTIPGRSLDILRRVLPSNQFLEIDPLLPMEIPGILQKNLVGIGRQITYDQTQKLVDVYQKSPSSLFLSLGTKLAAMWRSYESLDLYENVSDLLEMTEVFMERVEDKRGHTLVHHALAYMTASKSGLSNSELEDILSCDDEVLEAVFPNVSVPVRRLPPCHLTRIRHDLSPFLVEKSNCGMTLVTWCHKEIADFARGRYLVNPFRNDKESFENKARKAIADYFDNKWVNGKVHSNLNHSTSAEKFAKLELRHLLNQPLVTCGDRSNGRQFNSRKLSELPYQLIKLNDWNRFVSIMRLNFIEAKFHDGLGFECFRDLSKAARLSNNKLLKQLTKLVASNLTVLWKEPFAIYQIASQFPNTSLIFKMLKACDARDIPIRFIRNVSTLKEDNTCEMTLLGHSAGVKYCDLSPSGDMIVSAADDGSMNIWYVLTGMELAAMTSLPLPIDTEEVEVLPSNPCCFSPAGDKIVVGTEDGSVLLLDNSGMLIQQETTDIERITCLKYSRDGKTLVTSFRRGHLYFWDAVTLEHQSTIQLEEVITGLDISPDGKLLAVSCARGLVLVDMENSVICSVNEDTLTLGNLDQEIPEWFAMCCTFHPRGDEVLIGSTDKSISQWGVSDGKIKNKILGHQDWVSSIKLNKAGDIMYSASGDRTVKVWSFQSKWTCISTLVGHSDVVTMVTLDPVNESYLVSSSMDGSLKVWNIESLTKKEDIHEKDDGFEEGSDVTDQDDDSDPSEHVPFNTLSLSPTSGTIVYSKGSDRYCRIRKPGCPTVHTTQLPSTVKQTAFTTDGSRVVILDTGLKKGGKKSTLVQTSIFICDADSGSTNHVLENSEFGDDERPTSLCCGSWFIAIGTNKGDVHVYDDKVFERIQQITWHDEITRLATCTVKNHVIAVSHTQAILWKVSLEGYETIAYLPDTEIRYTQCLFSPIGNCLVMGLENGEIHVWKISDAEVTLSASKTEHTSAVKDIGFSRSGDVMVTCGDRSMRVWDMTNGTTLKCAYYTTIERVVCLEEDVVLAGDYSGKLNTLTW